MLGHGEKNDSAYIAVTLYWPATSFAASTSHFKKFTFVCALARASKTGAIIWHGPHLRRMH